MRMDKRSKCLVCNVSLQFHHRKIDEERQSRKSYLAYHHKLDLTFQKFFCVDSWDSIKKGFEGVNLQPSDDNANKDLDCDSNNSKLLLLPFCTDCATVLCQLSSFHDQLLDIQKKIDKLVTTTNSKLIETAKQPQDDDEPLILDEKLGDCRGKYQHSLAARIRKSILQSHEAKKVVHSDVHLQQQQKPHNTNENKNPDISKPVLVTIGTQTDVIKILIRKEADPEQRRRDQEERQKLLEKQDSVNVFNVGVQVGAQLPPANFEVEVNFDGGTVNDKQVVLHKQNQGQQVAMDMDFLSEPSSIVKPGDVKKKPKMTRRKAKKIGENLFVYEQCQFTKGDFGFKCGQCDKVTVKQQDIVHHVKYTHCTGTFECQKCQKAFLTAHVLKVHKCEKKYEDGVAPNPPLKCVEVEPGKSFMVNGKWPFEQFEGGYQCGTCNNKRTAKRGMMEHIKVEHEGISFDCDICAKKFVCKAAMLAHRHSHSEEKTSLCFQCGKTFKGPSALTSHISFMHTKTRKRPPRHVPDCKLCDLKFNSHWAYYNHRKTIHGKRTDDDIIEEDKEMESEDEIEDEAEDEIEDEEEDEIEEEMSE